MPTSELAWLIKARWEIVPLSLATEPSQVGDLFPQTECLPLSKEKSFSPPPPPPPSLEHADNLVPGELCWYDPPTAICITGALE